MPEAAATATFFIRPFEASDLEDMHKLIVHNIQAGPGNLADFKKTFGSIDWWRKVLPELQSPQCPVVVAVRADSNPPLHAGNEAKQKHINKDKTSTIKKIFSFLRRGHENPRDSNDSGDTSNHGTRLRKGGSSSEDEEQQGHLLANLVDPHQLDKKLATTTVTAISSTTSSRLDSSYNGSILGLIIPVPYQRSKYHLQNLFLLRSVLPLEEVGTEIYKSIFTGLISAVVSMLRDRVQEQDSSTQPLPFRNLLDETPFRESSVAHCLARDAFIECGFEVVGRAKGLYDRGVGELEDRLTLQLVL